MSSKEKSERARSLLTAFLRENPGATAAEVQAFAAAYSEEAREIARIFAEFEQLRELDEAGPDGITHSISSVPLELEVDASVQATLAANLPRKTDAARRYRIDGEIAHGGMGSILKVWDNDLHRFLAMKVSLVKSASRASEVAEQLGSGKLARFLEEAQITGQLDHPGIVPVHELGLDEEGRVFFTMKLVKGRTLKEVIDEHRRDHGGWTLPRVLGLLLKVCDAMAYAHDKGVVHRDLKPINVMIGRYGEVYVMDWGLAKVLRGTTESKTALPSEDLASQTQLDTLRLREATDEAHSPLWTVEGNVVGTPPFMAPEQALDDTSAVGPQADVYAVGAILYQLLTGRLPYVDPAARYNAYVTWLMVRTGPPKPVTDLSPDQPAELVAICEKAMARDRAQRYSSMAALGEDMRAFLEGRVVRAFETGPWADARKWIVRNRALATAFTVGILGLAGGLVASLILRARAAHNEAVAVVERTKVLQLSDAKRLGELLAETHELWPVSSARVPAMQKWIDEARGLHEHVEELQKDLDQLRRERSRSGGEPAPAADAGIVLAATADRGAEATWLFDDDATQWYHDTLAALVHDLERLVDPDPHKGGIAEIAARIERAQSAYEASLVDPTAMELWQEASASIGDERECPYYEGLELQPQEGLLPIGRDPLSGFWEFSHLPSGEPLLRETDGSLLPIQESGIVFVLIPAGTAYLGGQNLDRGAPNYDPWTSPDDAATKTEQHTIDAFFCSKYEVTQGQWLRLCGSNPSALCPEDLFRTQRYPIQPFTLMDPVEQVSWIACSELCEHFRLAMPTMDQWEYAARGGASTPFANGGTEMSLEGFANIDDMTAKAGSGRSWDRKVDIEDHWCFTAPVGSFRPNAFGLHDVHGNVAEWCSNAMIFGVPALPNLLLTSLGEGNETRPYCGGSYADPATRTRLCTRGFASPKAFEMYIGLRVIRAIDP